MKFDPKSNISFIEVTRAAAKSNATYTSSAIDFSTGASASFYFTVGTVASGGTLDAHVEWSDDNSSYAEGTPHVDITQIVATGVQQLDITNPQKRYAKIVQVVGTNTVTYACIGAQPINSVTV